jgi:hypothetical protein
MSIAVVLHLREDSLEQGELVGAAEIVATGEVRRVRGTLELVAFLQTLVITRPRPHPERRFEPPP